MCEVSEVCEVSGVCRWVGVGGGRGCRYWGRVAVRTALPVRPAVVRYIYRGVRCRTAVYHPRPPHGYTYCVYPRPRAPACCCRCFYRTLQNLGGTCPPGLTPLDRIAPLTAPWSATRLGGYYGGSRGVLFHR